jgi:hypothetical protein
MGIRLHDTKRPPRFPPTPKDGCLIMKTTFIYQVVSNIDMNKFRLSVQDMADQGFVVDSFSTISSTGSSDVGVVFSALMRKTPEAEIKPTDGPDNNGGTPMGGRVVAFTPRLKMEGEMRKVA